MCVLFSPLNGVKALLVGADPKDIWHSAAICLARRFWPAMSVRLKANWILSRF